MVQDVHPNLVLAEVRVHKRKHLMVNCCIDQLVYIGRGKLSMGQALVLVREFDPTFIGLFYNDNVGGLMWPVVYFTYKVDLEKLLDLCHDSPALHCVYRVLFLLYGLVFEVNVKLVHSMTFISILSMSSCDHAKTYALFFRKFVTLCLWSIPNFAWMLNFLSSVRRR